MGSRNFVIDMSDTPVDISKATVDELKALAYDKIIQLQRIQNDISLIEAEISNKSLKTDHS